jgi:hypothetical protein
LKINICVACFAFAITLANIAAAQTTKPSAIVCDSFARDYSQRASARGQMLGGAAGGALLGLGIGSIAGRGGLGAGVGAGFGAIAGGARRQGAAQQMYSAAYQDCMAGRIHRLTPD